MDKANRAEYDVFIIRKIGIFCGALQMWKTDDAEAERNDSG